MQEAGCGWSVLWSSFFLKKVIGPLFMWTLNILLELAVTPSCARRIFGFCLGLGTRGWGGSLLINFARATGMVDGRETGLEGEYTGYSVYQEAICIYYCTA